MQRTLSILAAAAALALGAPAAAHALGYCVGTVAAECGGGTYPATGDGLQTAITTADVTVNLDGTPDTVRIGPGTYVRPGGDGFYTTGGDLMIEGAGQSTVLTTDAADSRTVLKVTAGGTAASVRNLRINLAGLSNGISDFRVVSDVRVTGPGSAILGIGMPAGGRLTRATIDPATVYFDGVHVVGGVVEDVVVRLRKGISSSNFGVAVVNANAPTTEATIRHLTVVGDGAAGATGVLGRALGTVTSRTLNVSLRDSVLRDLGVPLYRVGSIASDPNPGTTNIDYRYSSLDLTPGKSIADGVGSFTAGPGNLDNPDPLFAVEFNLLSGSPLIDAGDPAGPEAGDSATDVAGSPRIVRARRDIGAFESTAAGKSAASGGPNAAVATASDLGISPRSFLAGASGPSATATKLKKKSRRVGGKVSYTLNIAASVDFSVRQSRPGRRKGKGKKARCVPRTTKNAKARKCTRVVTLRGSFTQPGKAGANSFRFTGRLGGRKLKPGRYTLVATPSANGKIGGPVSTSFRIVK